MKRDRKFCLDFEFVRTEEENQKKDAKEQLVSCFHPTRLEYQYSSRGGRSGENKSSSPIDGKLSLTLGQHRPTSISRSPGRWNSNENLIETTLRSRLNFPKRLMILFRFSHRSSFFFREKQLSTQRYTYRTRIDRKVAVKKFIARRLFIHQNPTFKLISNLTIIRNIKTLI